MKKYAEEMESQYSSTIIFQIDEHVTELQLRMETRYAIDTQGNDAFPIYVAGVPGDFVVAVNISGTIKIIELKEER